MCSLTELDAAYKCCLCGYFPVILTFDVIRKAAFFMGELERRDKDGVSDKVDCEKFWRCVEESVIEESLNGTIRCGNIVPSLEFWAPWIPIQSRSSCEVYNTEYKKGAQEDEHHQYLSSLSEERLEEVFSNGDLKVLRQLCEECGIPCKRMTKIECITRLKSAIKSNCDIDKMFFKIWQGSGGVLTATCPHGIVYALKFLLKAEGVRDAGDILLSLKHPPTVVISDVPHMLAAHVNKRSPDFFSLYAGRVDEPSPENIERVKSQTYGQKSFPWISRMHQKAVSGINVAGTGIHPITHVTQHLSLYDKFHDGNSKSPLELLRSTSLVKELDGICTETCEQLNADLAQDTSFLNSMKPINYMQMIRMICAVRNNLKNSNLRAKMKDLVGYGKLIDDQFGRLIIEGIESPTLNASSLNTAMLCTPTSTKPAATPASPAFDTLGRRLVIPLTPQKLIIDMLPNEMLLKIFEKSCKNKYDVTLLKNVCTRWNSLLDRKFEERLYKRNILNAIHWSSNQSELKGLLVDCNRAMVWLQNNLDKFKVIPELPSIIHHAEREFVDFANAYLMHNIIPRNHDLDDDLEWSNDMVGRINDAMCFQFIVMDDMQLFLNEMKLLGTEPGVRLVDNH